MVIPDCTGYEVIAALAQTRADINAGESVKQASEELTAFLRLQVAAPIATEWEHDGNLYLPALR